MNDEFMRCNHGTVKAACETCAAWEAAIYSQKRAEKAEAEVERLKGHLEQTVMQLAACGVAATQDTEASRKERIDKSNTYYSDSYAQVCRVVDRYMEARAEVERLTKTLHEVRVSRSQLDCRYTPGPYADSGGNHCPVDKPCERCRHESEVERLKGRVVELERLNGWLSKIADARKAELERYNPPSALRPPTGWVPMLSDNGHYWGCPVATGGKCDCGGPMGKEIIR